MVNRKKVFLITAMMLLGALVVLLAGYGYIFGFTSGSHIVTPLPGTIMPSELVVLEIPLEGAVAKVKSELSGLAWFGDYLILLPQYPRRFGEGDGAVFALYNQDILAFIEGKSTNPLRPIEIPLVTGGFEKDIRGFEGFEAIAIRDQRVYLTIEAESGGIMSGYLVSGQILADLGEIRLETETLTEIPMQVQIGNKSDEAIILANDRLFTLYEVNGEDYYPAPQATCFDFNLTSCPAIAFPHLEYRLTDATELDELGLFWVINYQFPGDINIKPKNDPLANQYGQGASHINSNAVERLVEYQYTGETIRRTDRPPLQLQLISEARNWEGIVRLDSVGFLLVTDSYPQTILGFVALP